MATKNKYRILIWLIIVLVATNLSMGLSFFYHTKQDRQLSQQAEQANIEVPAQQRTRFFREQLNLNPQQVEVFRTLNRDFNRNAWQIQNQLAGLRRAMVNEMGHKDADEQELNDIATQIGELHIQLKKQTIEYYRAMKNECTDEQQEKLNKIFLSILNENEDVRLPQGGRRLRDTR